MAAWGTELFVVPKIQQTHYLCRPFASLRFRHINYYILKKILSIGLIALILLQSSGKIWIYFSFKINQQYIAKALCINRDKPEMHCNGQCVLMQRIRASEAAERQKIPLKLKEYPEAVYCFLPEQWDIQPEALEQPKKRAITVYQPPFTAIWVKGIFHPPQPGQFKDHTSARLAAV